MAATVWAVRASVSPAVATGGASEPAPELFVELRDVVPAGAPPRKISPASVRQDGAKKQSATSSATHLVVGFDIGFGGPKTASRRTVFGRFYRSIFNRQIVTISRRKRGKIGSLSAR
jgi:hypothetical protein